MSPSTFSIPGIRLPANHPLLLDGHQPGPARSHLPWEVFPGFPWPTSSTFLGILSPTSFLPFLSRLEVPGGQELAGT